MKKLKYFAFFLGVTSTDVNCLISSASSINFGELEYTEDSLTTCKSLLEKNHGSVELKTCKQEESDGVFVLDCSLDAPTDSCPGAPTGCSGEDNSQTENGDHFCQYKCLDASLPASCSSDFNFPLRTTTNLLCFNQDYKRCQFATEIDETDQIDQIKKTCRKDACGYEPVITTGNLEISFANNIFTSTYRVDLSATAGNIFGCSGGKTSDGCSCDYPDDDSSFTAHETSMSCTEDFYTNQCSSKYCKDNKCYNGSPIMDYKFDNCEIESEQIKFCAEDTKVYLPCGDFLHECSPGSEGIDCTCYKMLDEASCKRVGGVFTSNELEDSKDSECKISGININQDMMECDKMTCFNSTFFEEDCLDKNDIFQGSFWQCYDEFEYYKVTNPSTAGGYNKVEKTPGSYDNLLECVETDWLEGFYKCKDNEATKSEDYCLSFGSYFVEKKSASLTSSRVDSLPAPFEFICLSISAKFNAVNNVNPDVDQKSECYELTEPENNESKICPDIAGCSKSAENKENFPTFGFYECQCDEECHYKCSSSKYDPVFPDGFTEDVKFTTYDCEKDNLIMIICTSIFVPLGVAGIAAGVYFFFFHESSEVAPVETDDELTTTEGSDKRPVEEDKEETHSETVKND